MRVRDLLIVAAVLLLGGFAAADALRGDADPPRPEAKETVSSQESRRGDTAQVETVEGARPRLLEGRLVYTDRACALRELDFGGAVLSDLGTIRTSCGLVAPAEAARLAFSLPSRRRGVVPYRVVDLERQGAELATFQARIRSVVWSVDGELVAWCDPSGRGWELELGSVPRRILGCPIAYTRSREPAYALGRLLLAGERPRLRVAGRIVAASFGADGSAAVATPSRLLLYDDAESAEPVLLNEVRLPPELRGLDVRFSPTHCHAALLSSVFPPTPTVFVVSLQPCSDSLAPVTFAGRAAAWSPDGRHLAVAERERVVIHPLYGNDPVVVLRIAASDLAWRS